MGDPRIHIRTPDEIERIRRSASIVAECLRVVKGMIRPGLTTGEIDSAVEDLILRAGASPSFKGYMGYPASTCISVNEQVVHGIPGSRVLGEGDIVSVDVGVFLDGYHGDGAWTFPVGEVSGKASDLMNVTRECLDRAIRQAVAGRRVGDISSAIQVHAERRGYEVVRQLVGHGIGRSLHEGPQVPNYGTPGRGPLLRPGMVLAIEPMVNEGTSDVCTLEDDWTVVTRDRRLSAHYEHTVAITEEGPDILTAPQDGGGEL